MASDPSEFGDEAAGDELGGVSCMLHKEVQTVVAEWVGWCSVGARAQRDRGRSRQAEESEREGYSRFAFLDVCIFVTASEGEELIVDIIGRHGEISRSRKSLSFRRVRWVGGARTQSQGRL
jgi:hypothetical protein